MKLCCSGIWGYKLRAGVCARVYLRVNKQNMTRSSKKLFLLKLLVNLLSPSFPERELLVHCAPCSRFFLKNKSEQHTCGHHRLLCIPTSTMPHFCNHHSTDRSAFFVLVTKLAEQSQACLGLWSNGANCASQMFTLAGAWLPTTTGGNEDLSMGAGDRFRQEFPLRFAKNLHCSWHLYKIFVLYSYAFKTVT